MGEVDTATVQAARRGDADAWDALFRTHQLPLYVFVIKMVRNETTALDLVQETFIAATKYLGSLKNDERFVSWLFSIARQKCAGHWRKHREMESLPEDLGVVEKGLPGDWLVAAEQESQLNEQIGKLPDPHREVIILFFLKEFSIEEIAVITDSRPGTVKSRLHYAKKTLRKLLESENEITERHPARATR